MVTMQDVANRAGVSLKTVSNVVNGFPSIRDSTRARVQDALVELGYRPNMAARSLAGGRTGLIATLVPYVNSSYFGRLTGSVANRSRVIGLTPVIQQSGGTAEGERDVVSHLQRHFVDGMVGTSLWLTDAEVAERTKPLPIVMIGQRLGREPLLDRVSVDCHAAGFDAVGHLLDQGRRRIALIGVRPQGYDTADGRFTGASAALAGHGLEPIVAAVSWYDHEHGYQAMQRLLADGHRFDGVFCFNDQLAMGALAALREAGVRCPDDVAVIGFDNTREGRFATTALTSVSFSTDEIAEAALARLAYVMDGNAAGEDPADIRIEHSIKVRESTVTGAGGGFGETQVRPDGTVVRPQVEIRTAAVPEAPVG